MKRPTWDLLRHHFPRRPIVEYGAVALVLFLLTAFHTNWMPFNIASQIFTETTGDATSGFLYLIFADSDLNPQWANTGLINYPYGQSLGSPLYITWFLVMSPLWLLSRLFSPIIALNLMTIIGYLSAGLVTYYFIKRLTNRWDVSFFAAYAVAFVPYHIAKSSDHLTNLFNWVYIAIIATLLAFWRRPTRLRGVALSVAIAAACYTDGYFLLGSFVLLLSLILPLVLLELYIGKSYVQVMKKLVKLGLVGLGALALVLPIIFTLIFSSASVNKDLANTRGDIYSEVVNYAAKPLDFILPPYKNPLVADTDWYKQALKVKNERSNPGESANYIGFSLFVLLVAAVVYIGFRIRRWKRDGKVDLVDYTLVAVVTAIPFVLLWMISPGISFLGIDIKTPTHLIIEYAPYWRVPSRLFLVLQPLVVIAASLMLYRLVQHKKLRGLKGTVVVLILCLILAVEYFSPIRRPSFTVNSMPTAYQWLSEQSDIKAVAEFPLIDRPPEVAGYYAFAQTIHKKPLVNTHLLQIPSGLFNPLGTIENEEAINFLLARGVNTAVVHDESCKNIRWGELIYSERNTRSPQLESKKRESTCIYRITKSNPDDEYFALTQGGFSKISFMDKTTRRGHGILLDDSYGMIRVVNDEGNPYQKPGKAEISMNINDTSDNPKDYLLWSISQEGKVLAEGDTSVTTFISADINVAKKVDITVLQRDGSVVRGDQVLVEEIKVTANN